MLHPMSWEGRSGSSMATTKALWAREAHLWPSETPRAAPHQNKERSLQDTPSRPHCFPTCAHTRGHTHIHTYTLSWGPVITGPGFPGEGKEDPGPQGWGVVIRGPGEGAHLDTARLSQPGPQTSTQRKSQLCGPRLLPGAGWRQGTAGCCGLGPAGGGQEKLET